MTNSFLDTLKYVRLNLSCFVDAAEPLRTKTVFAQDFYLGGVDMLQKIDETIAEAKPETQELLEALEWALENVRMPAFVEDAEVWAGELNKATKTVSKARGEN